MEFHTIDQAFNHTKELLDKISGIILAIECDFRTASRIIDKTQDHRQKYIDQILDLNAELSNVVTTYTPCGCDVKTPAEMIMGCVNKNTIS
jgi:hypothetical protein